LWYLHCSLSSPLPIPGTVSTGIIFAFSYMCMHYLLNIHHPNPFPITSPLPLVPTPDPGQRLFYPIVLQFCRRKNIKDSKRNMAFLLVRDKDSYAGRFLVLFSCIYIYYNPNWFISSSPLHSCLVPFPWWPQPV
jgi:hypothetical protein